MLPTAVQRAIFSTATRKQNGETMRHTYPSSPLATLVPHSNRYVWKTLQKREENDLNNFFYDNLVAS